MVLGQNRRRGKAAISCVKGVLHTTARTAGDATPVDGAAEFPAPTQAPRQWSGPSWWLTPRPLREGRQRHVVGGRLRVRVSASPTARPDSGISANVGCRGRAPRCRSAPSFFVPRDANTRRALFPFHVKRRRSLGRASPLGQHPNLTRALSLADRPTARQRYLRRT
jgi:hypothetical protein